MNLDIRFVNREDEARWLDSPAMTGIYLEGNYQRREVYEWLRESTQGEIVIFSVGHMKIRTDLPDHPQRWGHFEATRHVFKFSRRDDAMHFKLTWGGEEDLEGL